MLKIPLLLGILCGLLIASVELHAQPSPPCPGNELSCATAHGPYYTTGTSSPSFTLDCPDLYPFAYWSTVAYDLGAGTWEARTSGHDSSSGNSMLLGDIFRVDGPAELGLVTFGASLRFIGNLRASSFLAATLTAGPTTASVSWHALSSSGPYYIDVDSTIAIVLTKPVGEDFRLDMGMRSSAGFVRTTGSLSMSARLTFTDLPAGITVRSCQGFVQEAPVGVEPRTWSSVKARFDGDR